MRETADEYRVPTFSNAMDWEIYEFCRLAYFSHFLEVANSADAPGE